MLVAGGKGNDGGAEHHIRVLFKMLNAHGYEEHTVKSTKTDMIPAQDDESALAGVRKLAQWLEEGERETDARTSGGAAVGKMIW